ncbi:MAG TPA: TIGR03089 family protein [Mycobacterium sp.]|nr:TIGR03089 family protein [Mycobacterium sp.]
MRQLNLSVAVLDPLLGADASNPRFTYYDDATGERIELSTVTFANWAAKTGNLLRDELGAGPGSRVALLLPAHWQTAAVVFGVWWIGAEIVVGDAAGADVALCTADRLDEATSDEVVVLSLDPFGKPAPDLPPGVTDYATSVRAQADQITPERQPGPALGGRTADEVHRAAVDSAAAQDISAGDRVLSTAEWSSDVALVDGLVAIYAVGASLVQVAHPDPSAMGRRSETEKVTRVL